MIEIPTPTPAQIEEVLFGMIYGTNAFGRWRRLNDGSEEKRIAYTMWWADVISPDGFECEIFGGGSSPAEAAAAAWVELCLGAWWHDPPHESAEECLNSAELHDLSEEEYLSVPRRVPEGYRFELYAVPATFPGAERIQ
jgi:hypothetical protein